MAVVIKKMKTEIISQFALPFKVAAQKVLKEEALEMIKDAIKLHLEDKIENGEEIKVSSFGGKEAVMPFIKYRGTKVTVPIHEKKIRAKNCLSK